MSRAGKMVEELLHDVRKSLDKLDDATNKTTAYVDEKANDDQENDTPGLQRVYQLLIKQVETSTAATKKLNELDDVVWYLNQQYENKYLAQAEMKYNERPNRFETELDELEKKMESLLKNQSDLVCDLAAGEEKRRIMEEKMAETQISLESITNKTRRARIALLDVGRQTEEAILKRDSTLSEVEAARTNLNQLLEKSDRVKADLQQMETEMLEKKTEKNMSLSKENMKNGFVDDFIGDLEQARQYEDTISTGTGMIADEHDDGDKQSRKPRRRSRSISLVRSMGKSISRRLSASRERPPALDLDDAECILTDIRPLSN